MKKEEKSKNKDYNDTNSPDIVSAVALRYRKGEDTAPIVVAAGKGVIADRILEMAKESGIHIHQDRNLAESLMLLDPGEEIPLEMYETVATILAFVFQADQRQEGIKNEQYQ